MKEVSVPETRRRAILVLGMHRSGTSALTRILNLLGCELPRNLMSAAESNETGHWESTQIYQLNNRLLESAGTEWDDWSELNPDWLRSSLAQEFLEDACEVVEKEYQDSSLFVVKDPRICRIVPFWLEVFARLDVQPLVIIPLRNPIEVASSLEVRNNMDISYSHLVWLRHVLEAEYHTRGIPRYFTTYDQLITQWNRSLTEAQSVLGVEWPRTPAHSAEEVDAYISEELRHHHEPVKKFIDDASLSDWLRVSCEIVFQWADGGEDARAFDQLDRIRKEFNGAAPAFDKLLAQGRASQRHVEALEGELANNKSMLTHKNKELSALAAAHEKHVREHEKQLNEKERALEDLRIKNQETIEKLALTEKDAATKLREHEKQLNEKERALEDLRIKNQETIEKLALTEKDATTKLREHEKQLNEKERALEDLRIKNQETIEKLALTEKDAATKLWEKDAEVARISRRLENREQTVCQMREVAAAQLGEVISSLLERTTWSFLGLRRMKHKMKVLQYSGIIDAEWYLQNYPDVSRKGIDPLLHYTEFGAYEGREPNPRLAKVVAEI